MIHSLLVRLAGRGSDESRARSGAIAVIWALAAIPLIGLLVVAMEFTYALNIRNNLQSTLDAAMLAAGTETFESAEEERAFIQNFVKQNFPSQELVDTLTIRTSKVGDGDLEGTASIKSDLLLPGVFDTENFDINARAVTRRQAVAVEAMLVLDVTGSMKGTRLSTLQQASKDFVKSIIEGEGVKIGIVPFAQYVNIGTSNRNLAGFSIPADYETCKDQKVGTQTCTGSTQGTCYNDGVPYSCVKKTGCTTTYVTKNVCTKFKWNGCVGSRQSPLNANDSTPETPIPGVLNVSCNGSTLVRLTNNASALEAAINKMSASGNTYVPSGLMMGWHALSPRAPLPDGTPDTEERKPLRTIVLMTDGANTASKNNADAYHNGSSQSAADALTATLCENVKKDGIVLYAIAFEVTDTKTVEMLDKCDSSGKAIDAKNSEELIEGFQKIVGRVSRLRLVQ